MPFERFTPRALRVLTTAQEFAVADGQFIGAHHLVTSLRFHEDGIAGHALADNGTTVDSLRQASHKRRPPTTPAAPEEALSSVGIDLQAVRDSVNDSFGEGTFHVPSNESPAFAPESKQVLEDTLRQALALDHHYLGTEHILLGVLASENSGTSLLRDVGINPTGFRDALLDYIRRAIPPATA